MSTQTPSLRELGPRICIFGPSNSGKSTLADAIARANGSKVVHIDLLRHQPNTDWLERSDEEFFALHDEAIQEPVWVMDGNYTNCLPQRVERATGMILLEASRWKCLWRYFRRTLFERGTRLGAIENTKETIKWIMIRWILVDAPRVRKKYAKMYEDWTLPKVKLSSQHALDSFYRDMHLDRHNNRKAV